METSTQTSPGVGQELLSDAKGVGSTAVNRLHSEVDTRKGEAATQVKSLSSAIDRAADGLDGDAPAWLKSAFTQGAQQVQKFADTLEQKDSRQIVNDISDFARTSPMTFLAACAAAGFAAARVFQAGSNANASIQPQPVGSNGIDEGAGAYGATSGFGATSTSASTSPPMSQPASPVGGQFA